MKDKQEEFSAYAAVQYATVEDLNKEARIRATNDNTIRVTVQDLSDDYEDFKASGGGGGGVSKDYVDKQDALKQDKTDQSLTTTDKTIVGGINELKTTKQDTLTSGTNIKTINSQSILGSGNLEISGGSSDVTKDYVDQQDNLLRDSINDNTTKINLKQDKLVDSGDTQNIKTINSQSILGSGNLEISGEGSTPLDNNIEIYDNESNNFVQYKMDLDWTKANDNSLTSKKYVDTQDASITSSISAKADKTYVDGELANKQDTLTSGTNIKTINSQSILGSGNLEINGEGSTPLDNNIEIYDNESNNFVQYKMELDWTKANDNSLTSKKYVDSELSEKQDTLTSGTNIKTINSQSILGEGNLEISGEGSTPLDNNIEIYDNESNNFVQYKMELDWTKANDNSLTSKKYVDEQDGLKADKTYVDQQDELKQDKLVDSGDTQNIKTINSQSILGSGNLQITGEGATPLDNNIEIYDNESNNFVQYKMELDWTKANDNSLTSKKYVDEQDALNQDKTDQSLTTTDKTIVGGINELKTATDENTTQISEKQDKLVDNGETQNIKTINSQSILGSGNLQITGEGATPLDNNIEIYDNESNNFVQYKMELDWTKANDNSLTSKKYVDSELSEKQDTLTSGTNIKTINSQSILGEGNLEISGEGSTPLDNNIEIYDNESNNFVQYKMDLDWTKASDNSLTSKKYVDEQDELKQDKLIDNGDTQNIKTINNQSILGSGNLQVTGEGATPLDNNIEIYDNESNNFVQYKMDLDWTKANDNSLTSKKYVDTQDASITSSISAKADKTYVDGELANKQDTLTSGTNIKTINSQSILGEGNLQITGEGATPLDNNIEIYDNESNNFVQYKMDLDWTKASDSSLTSKKYVDEQDTSITSSISTKADKTYVDEQDALKQDKTDQSLTTTDKTIVGGINELKTATDENTTQISEKQDKLVDNGETQNIKTINSQSILGSGNLQITGEGTTPLDNNIEIYDNESNNFVQYKMELDWTKANDNSLTSKKYVDTQDGLKADKTYVDSELSEKQDTLTSGTNIKTINSQSILGEGNLEISGEGSTPLDNNIEIYDNESNNFVQYKMDLDWTKASDNSLTSKKYVDEQDGLKADKTYVDQQDELKQDKLVDSGDTQNIKTINSQSILGSGNLQITGEGATPLDNNIEIYDNESNNFVQYKMDLDWTKANDNSLTSKKYVDEQDALKQDKTDQSLTTTDKTIVGAINELKTNKTDQSYVDGELASKQDTLTSGTNIKTINSQSILGEGNLEISGEGSTPLDNNIEIYDNESNNFVQYKMELDWTKANDNSLTSKKYVDEQDTSITSSISTKADKTYVDQQDNLKADKTYVDGELANKQDTLTSGTNIKTINSQSILGEGNLEISGGSGDVTKDYVDEQDNLLRSSINENTTQISTKQDKLVDTGETQNIKTINSQSILGSGNLQISGEGSTPLDNNIEIYDNESNNFVQYKMDLDWTKANDNSLTSKKYVDTQDALKQDKTDQSLTTTDKTIVGAINELKTNKTDQSYVDGELASKQDTLTSGTNIKTINSQSILGEGNLEISGEGSTPLDNNIEIYDNESNNFVQYKMELDWTKANDNSLTSKKYVDEQDALKADKTYVDEQNELKQDKTDPTLITTDKTVAGAINELKTSDIGGILSSIGSIASSISDLVTNKADKTYVDTQDELKQDKTDEELKTTDKTIVGAINELKTENEKGTLLDNNIEIYDNESNNFVQYKMDLDWTKANDNSLTSKKYVDTQDASITSSISAKADKTYVDQQDNLKADKTYVDNELTGKQDTLTSGTNIKTINSQSILGEGNLEISGGGGDVTKDYVDEQDNLLRSSINENTTQISAKQDKLVDTGETQNIKTINSQSILGSGNLEISGGASTPLDSNIEIYDNESNNFVQYKMDLDWTKANNNSLTSKKYVDEQDASITSSISTKADKTYVDQQDNLKADKTYVDTQDELKQDKTDQSLTTTDKTIVGAINELKTNKTDQSYVDGALTNKQDTLTSGTNIKTINSQSILGEGNLEISGGESSPLDSNIEIYDNESNNFVQYKMELDWTKANNNSLTSKKYVDDQDALKADKTYVDEQNELKQDKTDPTLITTDKTVAGAINELKTSDIGGILSSIGSIASSISDLVTNKADKTYVDTQDELKQDKTDEELKTTDKTIVGAINELKTANEKGTPLDSNIEIYDNESNNFVQYKMDLDWTKANDNSLTSKKYVDTQDASITSSISAKADKTYVDQQDNLKADKTYVDQQDNLKADKTYVDNELTGKQDTLTSGTTIKTINSQSILGSGNLEISSGESSPLDSNIEIYDNESNNFVQYKMDLDWTKANNNSLTSKKYVDDQDASITSSISAKADKTYVDQQDNLKADKTYVDTQDALKQDKTDQSLTTTDKTVVGAINELKTTTNGNTTKLDEKQDKTDQSLTTTAKTVAGAINELKTATNDNTTKLDEKQDKTDQSLTTTAKTVTGAINELKTATNDNTTKINEKQDKTDQSLTTTAKTVAGAINELKTNKTDQSYVDGALTNKQDTLTSGTNIKTINSQSILGSGNLEISGGESSPLENNIEIYDNESNNFVQYKMDLDWTKASDSSLTSKKYVNLYVNEQDALKQDKLVDTGDTQNIKTINSQSILGSGNLEISGGESSPLENNIEIYDNDSNNFVQYKMDLDWTKANNNSLTSKKYVDDKDAQKANKTYVDEQDALKQDKTDPTLITTDKTVAGAINELKTSDIGGILSSIGSIASSITDLVTNKADKTYVDTQDELKQDKTDEELKTTDKTIVGAINELKTANDEGSPLDSNIEIYDNESNNFVQYKMDLDWTKANNNSLTSKKYVDEQDALVTSSISTKADKTYVDEQDELKQNKTDPTLITTDKTVVGAINELKTSDIGGILSSIGSIASSISDLVTNKADKTLVETSLNLKQDKTDQQLETTDKTIVGAINELKTANDEGSPLDSNIEIYDNESNNFVQYKMDLDWTKASDNSLTSKKYVNLYVNEQDALKQDKLIDTGETQNIKTINSQSILGSGNLEISSGESSPLENNIEIYDNESNNFIQYKMELDWTKANDNSLTSKKYVDDQLANKVDKTYVDNQLALKQNQLTAIAPLQIKNFGRQFSLNDNSDHISIKNSRFFAKFKEIDLNTNSYVFEDYNSDYCYQFYFFFEVDNKKLVGCVERPVGLPSEYISSAVCADFTTTSSINMWFDPETKICQAQRWDQRPINIVKLIINSKIED